MTPREELKVERIKRDIVEKKKSEKVNSALKKIQERLNEKQLRNDCRNYLVKTRQMMNLRAKGEYLDLV